MSNNTDLWGLEPGEEANALCWYKRWSASIIPWDGRAPRESTEEVAARHEKARLICHRCPLLAACEQALSAMERQGLRIDGVMAGRYSDVRDSLGSREDGFRQAECRGCQVPLLPMRSNSWRVKPPAGARQHVGEGLCSECYPQLARFSAALSATTRSDQMNNSTGTSADDDAPGSMRRREAG